MGACPPPPPPRKIGGVKPFKIVSDIILGWKKYLVPRKGNWTNRAGGYSSGIELHYKTNHADHAASM